MREDDIQKEIFEHFNGAFKYENPRRDEDLLDCILCQIDEIMINHLEKGVTMEEVRKVVY